MYKIISSLMVLLFITACETSGDVRERGNATLSELGHWRAIADSAYSKQQYQRAVNHYRKISAVVPQDTEVWFRMGNAYNRLGDTENALSAYKEVLVRDSTYSKAWYNSSMIQLKIAAEMFQEAVRYLKSDDPVYIASIRASEELLTLINDSNKIISAGYDTVKSSVLNPDDVEVIILNQDKKKPSTIKHEQSKKLKTLHDDKQGNSN